MPPAARTSRRRPRPDDGDRPDDGEARDSRDGGARGIVLAVDVGSYHAEPGAD